MKRVMYVQDSLNNNKYILIKEYGGFGIYQEKCPSGYFVSQSWLVHNGSIGFICESYNNYCEEELLDVIDHYNEHYSFGLHGFLADKEQVIYGVHRCNYDYRF